MNRPWMPWYIADYLADTAHLRAAQSGAYLHLIMHYWQRGGLPSENVQLAAIARMSDSEWKKARPIIEPFFQMPGWRHKRVDEELAKSLAKYEARAAAGKKGGEAKAEAKQKPSNATANEEAGLNQPLSQPLPPSNPESKNESALSILDSRAEKDRPIPIDMDYQPSDPAIEYAYSLGMKAADLKSELSKFINHCMGLRIASYNPDANFKKWCDQWLDYKRKHEKPKGPEAPSIEPVPLSTADWQSTVSRFKGNRSLWSRHAGPEPGMAGCRCPVQVLVDAQIDPATGHDMTPAWFFIDHTTNEAAAFMHDAQSRRVRPPTVLKFLQDGVERCGFFSQIAIPRGYDEATGERIAPSANEDAA